MKEIARAKNFTLYKVTHAGVAAIVGAPYELQMALADGTTEHYGYTTAKAARAAFKLACRGVDPNTIFESDIE